MYQVLDKDTIKREILPQLVNLFKCRLIITYTVCFVIKYFDNI